MTHKKTWKADVGPRSLPEIERYNYIGPNNYDYPNYDTTKAERKIMLYFNSEGAVIIMAWAGEGYVFWLSMTKTEDMEINRQIFHHIAYDGLEYVSRLPKALAAANMKCSSLADFYEVELRQVPELKRNKEILRTWTTPFGHRYEKECAEQNGTRFAEDIRGFGDILRAKCGARECGGCYGAVLKSYVAELEKAEAYDDRVQLMEEILRGESYLCMSLNEEIRKSYLYCRMRCEELREKYGA